MKSMVIYCVYKMISEAHFLLTSSSILCSYLRRAFIEIRINITEFIGTYTHAYITFDLNIRVTHVQTDIKTCLISHYFPN